MKILQERQGRRSDRAPSRNPLLYICIPFLGDKRGYECDCDLVTELAKRLHEPAGALLLSLRIRFELLHAASSKPRGRVDGRSNSPVEAADDETQLKVTDHQNRFHSASGSVGVEFFPSCFPTRKKFLLEAKPIHVSDARSPLKDQIEIMDAARP